MTNGGEHIFLLCGNSIVVSDSRRTPNTSSAISGVCSISIPPNSSSSQEILNKERKMGSDVLVARTGREKQRYHEHFRLVSGCIPYKVIEVEDDHSDDLLNGLLVLMIATPNRSDLVFPKGGWEDDESDVDAASREALEEAGVRGTIQMKLGEWEFKSKSQENSIGLKGWCKGSMFALEVTEELHTWPEQHCYERKWLTVKEAWDLCRYEWMREALNKCLVFLSGNKESPSSFSSSSSPGNEVPIPSMSARLSPLRETTSVLCVDGSA